MNYSPPLYPNVLVPPVSLAFLSVTVIVRLFKATLCVALTGLLVGGMGGRAQTVGEFGPGAFGTHLRICIDLHRDANSWASCLPCKQGCHTASGMKGAHFRWRAAAASAQHATPVVGLQRASFTLHTLHQGRATCASREWRERAQAGS